MDSVLGAVNEKPLGCQITFGFCKESLGALAVLRRGLESVIGILERVSCGPSVVHIIGFQKWSLEMTDSGLKMIRLRDRKNLDAPNRCHWRSVRASGIIILF